MLVFVVYLLLLPLASGLSAGACDCVGGENFNGSGWNGAAAAGADAALAGSISAAVLPGACLNATFAECDDPSSAINGAPECEPAVLDDFVASVSSGSIENCSKRHEVGHRNLLLRHIVADYSLRNRARFQAFGEEVGERCQNRLADSLDVRKPGTVVRIADEHVRGTSDCGVLVARSRQV